MQQNKPSDNEAIKAITSAIRCEENKLRSKHTWLAHQNILGFALFTLSLAGFVMVGVCYYQEMIPAWLCILLAALFASINHEIEHDLIHRQYFSKQPIVYHFMMLMVWLMRPNTINPWYRRKIHLQHHKFSGTPQDLEERLVGNGVQSLFLRLLIICDGLLGLVINAKTFKREIKDFNFFHVFNAGFPITTCYYLFLYSFLVFHTVAWLYQEGVTYPSWLLTYMSWVNLIMVVMIAPNLLRAICLNLITSSMHYYGNVHNLLQQTQVLNHWAFMPFQLFCFNFGNTHGIHHFVPNQPFYIRQLISKPILATMREHGVRFNDLASIVKANIFEFKAHEKP